jgi:protein required for attachment to host cells
MKKTITWFLVADGARARILMNDGVGKGLQPAVNGEFSRPLPPTRELGSDRPGRSQQRGVAGRHAFAPHLDWHEFEKEKFGREMARILDQAAERCAFDRLVLVAPPRALGNLRSALAPRTRSLVHAEIDKDLTNLPVGALPAHLTDVMAL